MTKERIRELRLTAVDLDDWQSSAASETVEECLDEIERLQGEVKTLRETPVGVAVTQAQRLGKELAALRASTSKVEA